MKKSFAVVNSLILIIVALILFQNATAQSRIDRLLLKEATRVTNDDFKNYSETPNGARVYSVDQPTSRMLSAIDKGLTELFAVARKNKYFNRLNYSDYTIFIAQADRTKDSGGNYSPDIAVSAAQYAGSVYDKGGYIYAAGIVIAKNPCAFVIADHTKNLQRVTDIVRFEGEHLILYHNDRRLYNQTADHSQGGGHPILK